ncbi:hypothetical protein AMAG_10736 [Allomyces macrogynus ATCC 38327]|uniref:Peroxin-7 n=1 Tax=Allomyces macrogynus (strain ATCC 38327) TaxID=578462 RepID=A0A0L0SRD1_ALLM3|nr:hypothetical protein AMAG_10736 [Allomyces macrogynus ATCC 38327]|eukprot:KNE65072.1 hypothetical protein AMAG_10736 [Allomyces macrogynus ATCC 38327]
MNPPPGPPAANAPPPLYSFRTPQYQGYAVEFSPFFENRLAVASAANFGIVGNGRLWILDMPPQPGALAPQTHFDTQDGLYDLAWSELNEFQLVTGSGDGSIRLWDTTLTEFPIAGWHEHAREVFSVHWNQVAKDSFASASWDSSIKIWSPSHPSSLATLTGHTECVYAATWSPSAATTLASGSGDRTLRVWDTRHPTAPTASVRAHAHDVLSVDWDKYRPYILYTASADRDVSIWDARRLDGPVAHAGSHRFPARRVKASPHVPGRAASVAYDMTASVWDVAIDAVAPVQAPMAGGAVAGVSRHVWMSGVHTEFVLGCDWSLFHRGRLATCGWDGLVAVHQLPPPIA